MPIGLVAVVFADGSRIAWGNPALSRDNWNDYTARFCRDFEAQSHPRPNEGDSANGSKKKSSISLSKAGIPILYVGSDDAKKLRKTSAQMFAVFPNGDTAAIAVVGQGLALASHLNGDDGVPIPVAVNLAPLVLKTTKAAAENPVKAAHSLPAVIILEHHPVVQGAVKQAGKILRWARQ